jgi:hypothetical protein
MLKLEREVRENSMRTPESSMVREQICGGYLVGFMLQGAWLELLQQKNSLGFEVKRT